LCSLTIGTPGYFPDNLIQKYASVAAAEPPVAAPTQKFCQPWAVTQAADGVSSVVAIADAVGAAGLKSGQPLRTT
jgi:hypothetical protein